MTDPDATMHQAPTAGELDPRFEQLVSERFHRMLRETPMMATYFGIHTEDGRLADLSREAKLASIEAERRFLADVESLDPERLSAPQRFEREMAIAVAKRSLFDAEVHRMWERRASASDEIGDGAFLLFARDFAPMSERLVSITQRLEAGPTALDQARDRLVERPVRLWTELELQAVEGLPSFFAEIVTAGEGEWGPDSPEQRRLERAVVAVESALESYAAWLRERLADATDDFALGREAYDELIGLRALDGLTSDDILEIGEQQLASNHAGRAAAARELDPDADEAEVLARIKADHPASFDQALDGYRDVMSRARAFIIEHDLATLPVGDQLSVVPTPTYLRKVMPFAAYFQPAKFDEEHRGIYIVTPSVDGDPRAMREHSWASMSNTSIHEAYPGHHHQLSAAIQHPSLMRLMTDAPEFVEGWGMYSEQMMREEGFDATPAHRVIMYTDAIWRSCRIILDIRLHRGEISVAEAIDFLVAHTGFERPNATAEVNRYTSTPTYQLSYLLGKVLLLRLREDERRRLGLVVLAEAIPRRAALLGKHPGQLPPPAPARARVAARPTPTERPCRPDARHPQPRPRERPIEGGLVAGCGRRHRRTDRSSRAHLPLVRRSGRVPDPPGRPGRCQAGQPGEPRRDRGRRPRGRDTAPGGRGCRRPRADRAVLRGGRDPRGRAGLGGRGGSRAPRGVSPSRRRLAGDRRRRAAGAARGIPLATHDACRRCPSSWPSWRTPVYAGSSSPTGVPLPTPRRSALLTADLDADVLLAGGVADVALLPRIRDAGVRGVILGEALLSGAVDFAAALQAAA